MCDGHGRPLTLLPTDGNDADAIRRIIDSRSAVPNISFKTNRRWKGCSSLYLYQRRNADERMFGQLKDFHCVATRQGKLAANFLATVHIAALIS